MIRKGLLMVGAALFLFLNAFASTGLAQEERLTWKLATLAPKGVGWAKHVAEMFIPEMDKATDDTMMFKVFWGGVMGDDEDYVKKMRIGQLDGAGMTAQGAILLCKEWAVVEIPFLFRNYDEVDYIRGKMTPAFDELMTDQGYKLIVWIDQDFDKIYSINHPLVSLEDFRKSKMVTWYGPLEELVLTKLGCSPIPVNVPEIPAALRSGIVDANIAPAIWMVGTQMYSVSRYVNTMNIRYAPALILVTQEAWKRVEKKYRDQIMAVRDDVTAKFVAGIREDNAKSLDAMLKYGLQEANPDAAEMKKIRQALAPVADEMADDLYPRELLDEIMEHLEQYREMHP